MERFKRIAIFLVFLPVFLFSVFKSPVVYDIIIIAALAGALVEYHLMLKKAGIQTLLWANLLFLVICIYEFLGTVPYYPAFDILKVFALMILYAALVLVPPIFKKDIKDGMLSMAFTVLGGFYIIVLGVQLLQVIHLGPYYALFLFGVVWIYDSAAYFIGTAIGRHKLLKPVSPKKSIEGLLGGLAVVAVAALVLKLATGGRFIEMDTGRAVFFAVILGLSAQAGDLTESLIKRFSGVKDSSNIIPGHGGLLDKLDSFLLAAPVFILLIHYF